MKLCLVRLFVGYLRRFFFETANSSPTPNQLASNYPPPPLLSSRPRLDESVDCSQRAAPAWMAAGGDGAEGGGDAVEDDEMGDFMAEILAEEVLSLCVRARFAYVRKREEQEL